MLLFTSRKNAKRASRFAKELEGLCVNSTVRVHREEASWSFVWSSGLSINGDCSWRLLSKERIEVCGDDDHQLFGLEVPIDAESKFNGLIGDSKVEGIVADAVTGDVVISFDNRMTLQLITTSIAYEQWNAYSNGDWIGGGTNEGRLF